MISNHINNMYAVNVCENVGGFIVSINVTH